MGGCITSHTSDCETYVASNRDSITIQMDHDCKRAARSEHHYHVNLKRSNNRDYHNEIMTGIEIHQWFKLRYMEVPRHFACCQDTAKFPANMEPKENEKNEASVTPLNFNHECLENKNHHQKYLKLDVIKLVILTIEGPKSHLVHSVFIFCEF